MAIFGLLLVLLGVGVGVVSLFGLDYDTDGEREVAILSNNTTPEMVFLLGLVTGVVILLGLWTMKAGAKRSLARRKELKRVDELSEQLEVERRKNREAQAPPETGTEPGTEPGTRPPGHRR